MRAAGSLVTTLDRNGSEEIVDSYFLDANFMACSVLRKTLTEK